MIIELIYKKEYCMCYLAKIFNTTIEEISKLNNIKNREEIKENQIIKINIGDKNNGSNNK